MTVQKYFFVLLILFVVVAPASFCNAKSSIWSETKIANLIYFWNRAYNSNGISGWSPALQNPNISVTYNVSVENTDTNLIVSDSSFVTAGTHLRFIFIPHYYIDVYWYGTGYSSDSPYGKWGDPNIAPTLNCSASDQMTNTGAQCGSPFDYFDPYISLIVAVPAKDITNLSGLNCGDLFSYNLGDGGTVGYYMDCTVNNNTTGSTITLQPTFVFNTTYGEFYYAYFDRRNFCGPPCVSIFGVYCAPVCLPGCFSNAIPLRADATGQPFICANLGSYSLFSPGSNPTYIITVPEQTIPYTLYVSANLPTATCKATPSVPQANQSVTWSAVVTGNGTPNYTYRWEGACEGTYSNCTGNGTDCTCTKSGGYTNGSPQATVHITDSVGSQTNPDPVCTATVNTNPPCTSMGPLASLFNAIAKLFGKDLCYNK